MENCVAPGLDEFDVIIRSCIVFSQSIRNRGCSDTYWMHSEDWSDWADAA